MTHLADEDLLRMLEGEPLSRAHMDDCGACGTRYEEFRALQDLLAGSRVQDTSRPTGTAALEDLLVQAEERAREDRAAEERCGALGTTNPAVFATPPTSGGMIRRCIAEARAHLDRLPEHSLTFLTIAATLIDQLEDALARPEHRSLMERERANAYRKLGRFHESLQALDRAEQAIDALSATAFERVFIQWSRASTLYVMTRYSEALPLAEDAERRFREFGDEQRAEQVRMLRTAIICDQGNVERARRMYLRLARRFGDWDDQEMVARAYANLADCEARLDRPTAARDFARRAMDAYDRLGRDTERVRVEWTLGYSLSRQGHYQEALDCLTSTAAWFQGRGMQADAAEVILDIIEIHLQTGDWTAALALASDVSTALAETPLPLARAYSYLRDAVTAQRATPALIGYLRSWATATEETAFAPPM